MIKRLGKSKATQKIEYTEYILVVARHSFPLKKFTTDHCLLRVATVMWLNYCHNGVIPYLFNVSVCQRLILTLLITGLLETSTDKVMYMTLK